MMRETEIVAASDQIHARLKSFEATGGMTRSARQARQPLPERCIQAFNKSRVEDYAPSRTLQQLLSLRQQTMSHPPRDLDDPFVLRSLDHGANVQLRPDLQARSSNSRSLSTQGGGARKPRIGEPGTSSGQPGRDHARAEPPHPTTGGSKPSWPIPSKRPSCILSP